MVPRAVSSRRTKLHHHSIALFLACRGGLREFSPFNTEPDVTSRRKRFTLCQKKETPAPMSSPVRNNQEKGVASLDG
jgi:hypothetical protein